MQSSSERMHRPDMTIITEMPTSDWLSKGVLHAPCNNLGFGKNVDRLSRKHTLQRDPPAQSPHELARCPAASRSAISVICKVRGQEGEHNFRLVQDFGSKPTEIV